MGLTGKNLPENGPLYARQHRCYGLGNLPNELPRDASRYFGEQLIKYVLEDLIKTGSPVIERATMVKNGQLTPHFSYLRDYAGVA